MQRPLMILCVSEDLPTTIGLVALLRNSTVHVHMNQPSCASNAPRKRPRISQPIAGRFRRRDDLAFEGQFLDQTQAEWKPKIQPDCQLHALDQEIAHSDRTIAALARNDAMARCLMTIPGLGPVTASAMAATIQDVSAFLGPREFAAVLGLTPRQNSSGDKERLGRVSKMDNVIYGNYSSSEPMQSSITESRTKTPYGPGRRSSCRPSPSNLSRSLSPISWRASPSRSCAATQSITSSRYKAADIVAAAAA